MAAMQELCHDKVKQEDCYMRITTYQSSDGRELSGLAIMYILKATKSKSSN